MHTLPTHTVVQFNENHKWRGALGIITEVNPHQDQVRYTVGVPIPQEGTAYIFVTPDENAIEPIGPAVLIPSTATTDKKIKK